MKPLLVKRALGLLGLLGLLSCGPGAPCQSGAPVAPPPPPLVVVAPAPTHASSPPGAKPGEPFAVTRRQNYRIEFGAYAIEIDPVGGGRILEFSLNGKNILVSSLESPDAAGSSLWPSPQSDWNWPPPPELDNLPWKVTLEPRALLLESEVSAKLGIQVKQRITTELPTGSVLIDYEFINRGSSPRKVAPWQNTRVRPKGIFFYPAAKPTYGFKENSLTLTPEAGISWFLHEPELYTKDDKKSYADGEEGWFAHVDGQLLFIKQFENVQANDQPPKEGEIVIFVSHTGRFVEMEQQGSYQEIAPGASRFYRVRWLLRQLPEQLTAEKGNPTLVNYVREQLASIQL